MASWAGVELSMQAACRLLLTCRLVFSQILASYLVQKGPSYIRSKHILELGSGTGLVGLVAGVLGDTDVWITDQASVSLSPMLSLFRFRNNYIRIQ